MRTPRAAAASWTAVLATLVLVLGGCGGPSPRVWAAAVCDALAPWRTEISNLTRSTKEAMTAQTTPAQAKENLVRLLGGAERASETARQKVSDAGVPDVDQGETVVRRILASLAAVRDAYGRAKTTIDGLAITEASTFYDGVKAAVDKLNQEYDESGLDTSNLDSPELAQAFDQVPECR